MPHRIKEVPHPKTLVFGASVVIIVVLIAALGWFWRDSNSLHPHPSTIKIEQAIHDIKENA